MKVWKTARVLASCVCALTWAGAAASQCTSYPNQLQNGQVADANQVMANFNCAALLGAAHFSAPISVYGGAGGTSLWIYGGNGTGDLFQGAQFEMTNLNADPSVQNKYFRVDPLGGFDILNSAYTTALFQVSDAGSVYIAGSAGIGTMSPADNLDVNGQLVVGNSPERLSFNS